MNNEWKDIKGYEDLYQICTDGRVATLHNKGRGLFLKGYITPHGYKRVRLYKNKKARNVFVHRCVAEAFLGGGIGLEVNHKDGNKLNNYVDNLEWVTRQGNCQHSYDAGLRKPLIKGERNPHNKISGHQVRRIRLMKELSPHMSQREISLLYDIGRSSVGRILSKKSWSHIT